MSPEKIEWHSGLEVELQLIDREHRELVERLNQLIELLTGGAPRERWLEALDGLINHVVEHFTHEERVMENVRFPGYAEHRLHHQQLVQEVTEFRSGLNSAGDDDTLATIRFLKFWVIKHVVQEDLKIKSHVYQGLLPEGHKHDA